MLRRVAAPNRGPLPAEALARVFREVISACRALEQPLRVAYLGPAGTFSEMAVREALRRRASTRCRCAVDRRGVPRRPRPAPRSSRWCRSRTRPKARSGARSTCCSSTPLRICAEVGAARAPEPDGAAAARWHEVASASTRTPSRSRSATSWLNRKLPQRRAHPGRRATPRRRGSPPSEPAAAAIGRRSRPRALRPRDARARTSRTSRNNTTRFLVLGNARSRADRARPDLARHVGAQPAGRGARAAHAARRRTASA